VEKRCIILNNIFVRSVDIMRLKDLGSFEHWRYFINDIVVLMDQCENLEDFLKLKGRLEESLELYNEHK
jgi:hypothetical protein